MSKHPLNLALRFFLEMAALVALGVWGWTQNKGILAVVLAIGLPVFAAALWGIFRVPGDPGIAPISVPGWVRLILEFGLFGTAAVLLVYANLGFLAAIFAILVAGHYVASMDRIRWLLATR